VDRLFQIDLWRRAGTGRLAEILGPRRRWRGDQLAAGTRELPRRLVGRVGCLRQRIRGSIVTAFTDGHQRLCSEFEWEATGGLRLCGVRARPVDAGGLSEPRRAGLTMTHNLTKEVQRARIYSVADWSGVRARFGWSPRVASDGARGLDLSRSRAIFYRRTQTTGAVRLIRTGQQ